MIRQLSRGDGSTMRMKLKMLSFLVICSLLDLTSSLVTGRIQVKAPRGFARYADGDTTCNNLEDNSGGGVTTNTTATAASSSENDAKTKGTHFGDRRRSISARSIRRYSSSLEEQQQNQPQQYVSPEEKERRELEWVVRNTQKILGEESPTPGQMTEGKIQLTLQLMKTWARRVSTAETKSPHVVERLLQRLLQERDAGNNELVTIDTALYNVVLDGWSNSRETGSSERCEEILFEMERMCSQQGNSSHVQPDVSSYNAVVKAYVKNGSRAMAAPKVEAMVHRMEQSDFENVSPNRRTYNLLLYALANSSVEDAAKRAETTLHKMLTRYLEEANEAVKPDINSFNQVLGAWARGRHQRFENRMQSIYEELLQLPTEMGIQPNTDTFNAVMGGWLKSNHPRALSQIEKTLQVMEQMFEEGNEAAKPDRITINTVTAGYAKIGSSEAIEKSITLRSSMEQKYRIKPDAISHNILVDSWCKSGRLDAPERVVELLNAMERDFKRGNLASKPDGYTYSSVIGCFVKFGREDAPQSAEKILERMQNLYRHDGGDPVTTSVYNSVINAWASSNSKDALQRVKELLRTMEESADNDPSIPKANRITYNTVIKAMRDGTAEDAAYAEEILSTLEQKGVRNPHLLPDSYSYTSVITAYGRSDDQKKAQKSLSMLERMLRCYKEGNMAAKPTTHSFNAALNACAFVDGNQTQKTEAFEVAVQVYQLMQASSCGEADHTSYGTLLRACATLLHPTDPRREKLVEDIFHRACENGAVGRLVVTQLKFAATPAQHLRLTGRDIIDRINVKDLPRAWTRNVRETSRRPKGAFD